MDATAFWNVIGLYNAATLWLQIVLLVLLAASLLLTCSLKKGWILKLALAAVNLFIAFGFFAAYGTEPIQRYFALPLYTGVGLLFIYDARKNPDVQPGRPSVIQWLLMVLYLLYPVASIACGHAYPQLVTHIMPCPVVTLSIALYACYPKRNRWLLALLVIWGLTGVKAIFFSAYEDLILLAAGLYGLALFIRSFVSERSKAWQDADKLKLK